MNKQIISLILGILLLTNIYAVIYAGESVEIDIGEDYEYYSVVGNTSEVVLDIQQNGTILTITPNKYSIDDSYEIVFFNKEKETIYVSTGGGGGSSRTIYKNITEYKNKTIELEGKEKIVEIKGDEIIKEKTVFAKNAKLLLFFFILIIFVLLGYIISKSDYKAEKEVKQDE